MGKCSGPGGRNICNNHRTSLEEMQCWLAYHSHPAIYLSLFTELSSQDQNSWAPRMGFCVGGLGFWERCRIMAVDNASWIDGSTSLLVLVVQLFIFELQCVYVCMCACVCSAVSIRQGQQCGSVPTVVILSKQSVIIDNLWCHGLFRSPNYYFIVLPLPHIYILSPPNVERIDWSAIAELWYIPSDFQINFDRQLNRQNRNINGLAFFYISTINHKKCL